MVLSLGHPEGEAEKTFRSESIQPTAKSALNEVMNALTCKEAQKVIKSFVADFGAKYPKRSSTSRRTRARS